MILCLRSELIYTICYDNVIKELLRIQKSYGVRYRYDTIIGIFGKVSMICRVLISAKHIEFIRTDIFTLQVYNAVALFGTLRPKQNGRHFAGDIFKEVFFNENIWIPIKICPQVANWK